MARRTYSGSPLLPGMDGEPEPMNAPMPYAKSAGPPPQRRPAPVRRAAISRSRLIAMGLCALMVVGASVYAFFTVERFLIRDPRFMVNGSAAGSGATLKIIGAEHASLGAIESVFASDLSRSLYLVPLEERVTTLQAVDWVRDASVARIWPNGLLVKVAERAPVAFITLPSSKIGMIDADGVILPRVKAKFSLPVLAGVKVSDELGKRRASVQRMLRASGELGSAMQFISEIDVADPENVIVSQSGGGGVLRLMLGNRNFAARYQNFVKNYDQIRSHAPEANLLDLRLEDRVIAVEN